MYALTAVRGIGRRISNITCKKCDIDLNKRAGELTTDEVNKAHLVLRASSVVGGASSPVISHVVDGCT